MIMVYNVLLDNISPLQTLSCMCFSDILYTIFLTYIQATHQSYIYKNNSSTKLLIDYVRD
jgi:hypothetical protein